MLRHRQLIRKERGWSSWNEWCSITTASKFRRRRSSWCSAWITRRESHSGGPSLLKVHRIGTFCIYFTRSAAESLIATFQSLWRTTSVCPSTWRSAARALTREPLTKTEGEVCPHLASWELARYVGQTLFLVKPLCLVRIPKRNPHAWFS